MIEYSVLKKNIKKLKENQGLKEIELALLGDTATQFLRTAIEGYGYEAGYRAEIYESEYDVMETEILDASSGLYEKKRDYVVLYMSTERAYEAFTRLDEKERTSFARQYVDRIRDYWSVVRERTGAGIIQADFNRVDAGIYGQYGNRLKGAWEYQYAMLQHLLAEAAADTERVYLLGLDSIQTSLGRAVFCDMRFYYEARMSISTDALPAVAKGVWDIIAAADGRVRKCLVLDLDNTLWGGVIADDGLSGIELGELGKGRIYCDIQRWCLELKKRGVILAVCSKNDEDNAREPFEKHPDMVLRPDDIAMFVANWEDKASNIRRIQETLNIGMDSMVFLDDQAFERNLVKEMIPEITVPSLPEEPAEWPAYLKSLDLFETSSVSEGADRTKQYREEANRRAEKARHADVGEYLESLEMKACCAPFDEFRYPRIAELSQRSNQFNLRTVRYTEDQIKDIAQSDRYITLYFTLEDRFGDYGLVSCMIMEKTGEGEAFIDTWFMSCRVLQRGMEEFIINCAVEEAAKQGIEILTGEYIPTKKNRMVEKIYEKYGFKSQGDGRYRLETGKYKKLETKISKEAPSE